MTTPREPGPEGQGQPYEPMPAAPAVNEQDLTPAAVDRPKAVDNAFLLWMIGAGISLLSVIFVFTLGSDAITDATRESLRSSLGREPTNDEVSNAATLTKVIGIVIGLIFIGLYVLFAYKMRAGRNWARIVLTVLGALNIVFTLLNLSATGAIDLVVRLIMAVLILVAVYFMFRPESNQYFNANRVRR